MWGTTKLRTNPLPPPNHNGGDPPPARSALLRPDGRPNEGAGPPTVAEDAAAAAAPTIAAAAADDRRRRLMNHPPRGGRPPPPSKRFGRLVRASCRRCRSAHATPGPGPPLEPTPLSTGRAAAPIPTLGACRGSAARPSRCPSATNCKRGR